jgi:hypothetical protein
MLFSFAVQKNKRKTLAMFAAISHASNTGKNRSSMWRLLDAKTIAKKTQLSHIDMHVGGLFTCIYIEQIDTINTTKIFLNHTVADFPYHCPGAVSLAAISSTSILGSSQSLSHSHDQPAW